MSEKYPWINDYLLQKAGATTDYKAEWGWQRYQVGGKMFAAVCQPDKETYPLYQGRELLTLKCDVLLSEMLRAQYADIMAGFYMDKRNWISVFTDGAVPENVLRDLCDGAYTLVFQKLTKKAQKELAPSGEDV